MGTYLKNAGYHVRVLDGDSYGTDTRLDFADQETKYKQYLKELRQKKHHYWALLQAELERFRPQYIGITFWTTSIGASIKTAELCRQQCPTAKIIAGGPHVTLMPDDIKQIESIDIAVIGEGEQALLDIVNDKPLKEIDGIFYRSPKKINETRQRPFIEDLDSLGIPDRSLLINQKSYRVEDFGLIITSRGCPYSCAYCATAIWRRRVRYRSIDAIIDEIKLVKNAYGTLYFTIKDDSFTIDKNRVSEFCKKLKRKNLNIFWECNTNLVNIEEKLLTEMKDAGCIAIKIGIESGSDKIHKIINKKLTNAFIMQRWKDIRRVNIHITCYFMMGIPGETAEDILKTLQIADQLKPDYASYSIYEIFPSTRLHQLGINNHTALESMPIDDYLTVEPHHYYFKNYKRHIAGLSDERFSILEKKFRSALGKHNRSPRSIYARIKSRAPLYKRNVTYFIEDIKNFLKWI